MGVIVDEYGNIWTYHHMIIKYGAFLRLEYFQIIYDKFRIETHDFGDSPF